MKTGWLSPDGDMISCGSYDHIKTAHDLVQQCRYKTFFNDKNHPDDDTLMHYGWAYIGKSELDSNYRIGWSGYLTDAQKNVLRPYFEDGTAIDIWCRKRFEAEI